MPLWVNWSDHDLYLWPCTSLQLRSLTWWIFVVRFTEFTPLSTDIALRVLGVNGQTDRRWTTGRHNASAAYCWQRHKKLNTKEAGIHTYSRVSICCLWHHRFFATNNVHVCQKLIDQVKTKFRILKKLNVAFHHGHVRMCAHVPDFLQVWISDDSYCGAVQQSPSYWHNQATETKLWNDMKHSHIALTIIGSV